MTKIKEMRYALCDAEKKIGTGDGYRVTVYVDLDTNKAELNWSATGSQTPETALAFADALKKLSKLAAKYNRALEKEQ